MLPSDADRIPKANKGGSNVGSLFDASTNREVVRESDLERDVALILQACPTTAHILDQVKVEVRVKGRPTTYWVDFVLQKRCGRREALAVKPSDSRDMAKLRALMKAINAQHGESFAHRYAIVTEKHLTRISVANARCIISCVGDRDQPAQDAVGAFLRTAGPTVTAGSVARATGWDSRAIRATYALIKAGLVAVPPGAALDVETELQNLVWSAAKESRNHAA